MVREAAGLLQPRIAVVTTVGREHYKSFRTKEATAAEKSALVAALPDEGTAVLNADDPYVASMRGLARARILTFGTSAGATLRADGVRSAWPDRLTFTVHHDGRSFPVATKLCGTQWTSAVLAALAVGSVMDVPLEQGIEAVESFEPIAGRMSVVEDDGVTFIRDDWKAPLWTFDRVFDFMREARAARRVLLIGTVSDYSGSASRVYARLAERALSVADEVVFVGPQARHALKARTGTYGGALHAFPFVRDAAEHVGATVRNGDLVLVKGSVRVDHLLRVILARRQRVRCWREACGRQIFCDICRLRGVPSTRRGPLLRRGGDESRPLGNRSSSQRKLRIASRSTLSPITPLRPSTSRIAVAGTSRRLRERKPERTEIASGTSGAVPYIGHSTRPTKRPFASATM
jgi:UDP-N-acetylmuramoyl-tripeptide--D-alanyl-D-alanine ligase